MSAWEDLSPGVKRYLVLAAVLVAGMLAFRMCLGGESAEQPAQRGVRGQ